MKPLYINIHTPHGDHAYTEIALITKALLDLSEKLQRPIQIVLDDGETLDIVASKRASYETDCIISLEKES